MVEISYLFVNPTVSIINGNECHVNVDVQWKVLFVTMIMLVGNQEGPSGKQTNTHSDEWALNGEKDDQEIEN